jgi:hypothetical protein
MATSSSGNILPSQRKRPKWFKVPNGLIDVWRVSHHKPSGNGSSQWVLAGFFSSEEKAFDNADSLWLSLPLSSRTGIRVEHKAGLFIENKLYLVGVAPIKFKDDVPEPDKSDRNEEWLAEFSRDTLLDAAFSFEKLAGLSPGLTTEGPQRASIPTSTSVLPRCTPNYTDCLCPDDKLGD